MQNGSEKAARPPEGCPAEAGSLFGPESALGFEHPSGTNARRPSQKAGSSPLPRACRLSYAPPAYECGIRPFLRWVLSQGWSPTRQAVPKMPRTPSAFPFSGRLRRRAINPTRPKRVKAWGDGPWGQRWCIQWWNTPERTVQHAITAGRERPTAGHKETLRARRYLSLPPTRHDLTQGQKPEGRLKWG